MSTIREKIENTVMAACDTLSINREYGKVVRSQRPDLSQFQCNGALAAAKSMGKNPRELAQQLIQILQEDPRFSVLDIAGPGFINITISDEELLKSADYMAKDATLGIDTAKKACRIVLDFAGPNVAKPMHVGHLRSAIIGDSLQRLFRYLGYPVVSDNHLGDWGTQMGMLICALKEVAPDLSYFDETKTGDYPTEAPLTIEFLERLYPEASAACRADAEKMSVALRATDELQQGRPGYRALWEHFVALSVETLKKDFSQLDVSFDHWLGESFYMSRMADTVSFLRQKGFAVESEGALVMNVQTAEDKKEIPPVMLVKSGGGFLYATSDIATIAYRMEIFSADRICYVVDKRQSLHFEQVFRAVKNAGIVSEATVLEHVGFGTVNGQDGKPYKTREGGVMKLADLISLVREKARERMDEAGLARDEGEQERAVVADMVAMAALKFADLMNYRLSDYIFDVDKFSRFEGKTGPYLLYTAVRIKSILRKSSESGFAIGPIVAMLGDERELLLELSAFEDVLVLAAQDCAPNYLCDYLYTLSQVFNRFYNSCHIMRAKNEELRGSWLGIAALTLDTIDTILGILGINIPERM